MTNEMTAKEAVEILKYERDNDIFVATEYREKLHEALTKAIKALEAQTCENVNEDYAECDQFQCSECHIELQDWHRVERDDDDGEISYHEYTFRYCPNCGRRVKYAID